MNNHLYTTSLINTIANNLFKGNIVAILWGEQMFQVYGDENTAFCTEIQFILEDSELYKAYEYILLHKSFTKCTHTSTSTSSSIKNGIPCRYTDNSKPHRHIHTSNPGTGPVISLYRKSDILPLYFPLLRFPTTGGDGGGDAFLVHASEVAGSKAMAFHNVIVIQPVQLIKVLILLGVESQNEGEVGVVTLYTLWLARLRAALEEARIPVDTMLLSVAMRAYWENARIPGLVLGGWNVEVEGYMRGIGGVRCGGFGSGLWKDGFMRRRLCEEGV